MFKRNPASNVGPHAILDSVSGIDQAFAQGIGDKFSRRVHPGLAHYAGAMAVHGFDADAQGFANLAIGPSGNNKIQYLPFAICQWFKVRTVFKQLGVAAADYAAAIQNSRQGAREFVDIVGLAEYAVCADFDELSDLAERFDCGENNDAGVGRPAASLKQDFGSAGMRHGHI